ncbi:MAG: response regulator, partial [Proteobacteria bacterium]|nr:response regulator [Pseudomonadota bacterium]
ELVKQFLFFAREKEASAGQVLLVPIFKEALRFLRSALPAHVELVQEIPSAPLTILAAPLQIYLVIVGLGAWALEPLKDEGGVLEVTLNEAAFGIGDAGRRTGPWARLTVGHRRPFAGRDATRPSVDAGRVSWGRFTENGLAVLFSVVEANLGQVRMERLGEEGESWHVYFPLVEVPEEEREAIPVRDSSSRGCVLFIDKEPDLVEVASEMLRTLGYTVVAKTSCQAGLDAFRASPEAFDVVMASQFMSGMLGTELTVLLRKIRPGLPVVLSVGFDDAGFIEEARRAGVRKVLTQPVSMKDYEKALDQVLGNVRGT